MAVSNHSQLTFSLCMTHTYHLGLLLHQTQDRTVGHADCAGVKYLLPTAMQYACLFQRHHGNMQQWQHTYCTLREVNELHWRRWPPIVPYTLCCSEITAWFCPVIAVTEYKLLNASENENTPRISTHIALHLLDTHCRYPVACVPCDCYCSNPFNEVAKTMDGNRNALLARCCPAVPFQESSSRAGRTYNRFFTYEHHLYAITKLQPIQSS